MAASLWCCASECCVPTVAASAAPDILKPAGLRTARPGPSAKPSIQARPFTLSSSSSKGPQSSIQTSATPSNGMTHPSGPSPAPSGRAAAAYNRQQPSPVPSQNSQLTASLKGSTVGQGSGKPPTGAAASGQASGVSAAAPATIQHGFHPVAQTRLQASTASFGHSRPMQPLGASANTGQATTQAAQQQAGTAETAAVPRQDSGLHQQTDDEEPVRASYASKVAVHADPGSSNEGPRSQPHHRSRHKHHKGWGRGRGHDRQCPSVEGAPAASSGPAVGTQSSQDIQQPAAAQKPSQQQSPFASQKSLSFGHKAEASDAASASCSDAAAAASTDQASEQNSGQVDLSNDVREDGSASASMLSQQQQHPPFRDSPAPSATQQGFSDESVSQGGAQSSLGAENRDPKLSQEEARAASEQRAAAAHRDLLASPFKAINLESLPSLTKPVPPSKTNESLSSKPSSHKLTPASLLESAHSPCDAQPVCQADRARPSFPDAKATASRDSDRATAPAGAIDTATAPAVGVSTCSPTASAGTSRQQQPNCQDRQGHLPWDKANVPTSPNTPLALLKSSEVSLRDSESGPMHTSSCNDSGFSLLWDDDPFWQVSVALVLNCAHSFGPGRK